ncbi:MAG TPA: matrixin family metalloprotease [Solirubrobacterales bacterium]|nr:matrixin family metalloprotease [Solirubrobacterales bacterium]
MIVAAIGAAVSLAAPAPATLPGDLDAAAAYWHQNAPARCSTKAVGYGRLPGPLLGQATIPDPVESGPCEMTIELGLSNRLRCMTVVHEYGHWLGLEHSENRRSPMFPVIDRGAIVSECGRPQG